MEQIRSNHRLTRMIAAASLSLLFGAMSASAAIIPATWDFGTAPGKDDLSDFTVNGGTDVGLSADAATFKKSGDLGNRSIQTTVSELAAASKKNFTITTSYAPNHAAANNFDRFGIVMFSETLSSHTTGVAAVVLNSGSGVSLAFRTGIEGGILLSDLWTGVSRTSINGNPPMNLQVIGTYSGNDLTLDFTASYFNGTSTVTKTLSNTFVNAASTLTGTGFGVGGRIGGDNTWSVDTLSIIPEPASLTLLGMGGLLMMARSRKATA